VPACESRGHAAELRVPSVPSDVTKWRQCEGLLDLGTDVWPSELDKDSDGPDDVAACLRRGSLRKPVVESRSRVGTRNP
jgi:hypothetical protein